MGSGASAELSAKLEAASAAEVESFLSALPKEQQESISAALGAKQPASTEAESQESKPKWESCFVICGQYMCKDVPGFTAATLADAAIQVKEEPRAPRMTIMGVATNDSAPKEQVFWLAEFTEMEAWAGPDHKERESNKEYMKVYMASGQSSEEGMAGQLKDMAGSYVGGALHLERPGVASGENQTFAVQTKVITKDEASLAAGVDLLRSQGAMQVAEEGGGTLGYTIMCSKDMQGPMSKDDLELRWIELFATREAFDMHKGSKQLADLTAKLEGLITGPATTHEFAETKHYQK